MPLILWIKLGIEPLSKEAFEDIKSKVNLDNIAEEVFSPFTARYIPPFSPAVSVET